MKNLKLLFAVFIVTIATLFVYSCAKEGEEKKDTVFQDLNTKSRASEPCESIGECQGQIYNIGVESVSIPDYPGCTFDVEYRYRICGTKMDLILDKWYENPYCQAFNDDLQALIDINSPDIPLFLRKLQKKLMTALATKLAQNNTYINTPLCGIGLPTVSYGFTAGSCIKFCLLKLKKTFGDGLNQWVVINIPCGDACCRTSYTICKNLDGSLNIVQSQFSTQAVNGSCESQMPQISCPLNSFYTTSCVPNCQAL